MNTSASSSLYKHHHCPVEINRHGIWLYSRFCLSSRDVEALFFGRGMIMTDEAIRSPLNQPGNGRDVCSGASRPSTCSVFSPHMGLVPTPLTTPSSLIPPRVSSSHGPTLSELA